MLFAPRNTKGLDRLTAHTHKGRPFIDEFVISVAEIFCADFHLSIFLQANPAQNGKEEVELFFKIELLVFALISYSFLYIVFCAHWGMRKLKRKMSRNAGEIFSISSSRTL